MERDTAWKRLFALPVMVEYLLWAVALEFAGRLDFTAMAQLSANWTRPVDGRARRAAAKRRRGRGGGSAGAQRYGDAVWRIGYAGDDTRSLVLLLEFQSKPDPDMAARVLNYTGLLRVHLRRQGRLDSDGELCTLAAVLYSGTTRWSASGAAAAVPVSADGGLRMLIDYPYRLLDSRRVEVDDSAMRNPVLAVLGVERSSSPEDATQRMQALASWLPEVITDEEVRREFEASVTAWLSVTMPQLFPQAGAGQIERIGFEPFERGKAMTTLHLRVREWEQGWLAQGEARGKAEGEAKGRAEGIARERALLCKQARLKFGAAAAEELARRLEPVSDAEALEAVGGLIIRCDDGAELLARVRPNGDA